MQEHRAATANGLLPCSYLNNFLFYMMISDIQYYIIS